MPDATRSAAVGFIAVSIAATFSAGSAINATVFATARLAEQAAQDGEMPALFARRDKRNVPWFGTIVISAAAIVLVLVGGIEQLVEGGSFVFLLVFSLVNVLAILRKAGKRWIALVGLVGSWQRSDPAGAVSRRGRLRRSLTCTMPCNCALQRARAGVGGAVDWIERSA